MSPAAEGGARKAGDQKEEATRQAGDSDSGGGDEIGRQQGRNVTRQACDSNIRGGDETAEGRVARSMTTSDPESRKQATTRRG